MSLQKPVISRRTVLGGLGATAFTSIFSGCGSHLETGASTESAVSDPSTPAGATPSAASSSSAVQANVVVGSSALGTIGAGFCGLSYEKSQLALPFFEAQNLHAVALFKLLGSNGHLRIGGNSVDTTQWVANGRGQTAGQVAPSDVEALAAFANATGWGVLYGVNLATSTPALAAAEVAYAAKALGSKLVGVEIGNEPDGYGGNYFKSGWSPSAYVARWQQFATAILQQAPDVTLTGPAIGAINHVNTWTEPFCAAQAKTVKQVTQHYYRGDGHSSSSTMALMLSPDPVLTAGLEQLKAVASEYGVPFRITETNSYYNAGAPGASNTGGSALWAIDYLFQLAIGGSAGANFEGGGSYSKGYSPISDTSGLVLFPPQPLYYGLLLFTMAGTGTVLETTFSPGSANATAYTLKNSNGTLNVVIINKDSSKNLQLLINAGRKINKATAKLLAMPQLTSTTGLTIQGSGVGVDGSFSPKAATALTASGTNVPITVDAYSAAVIQIT